MNIIRTILYYFRKKKYIKLYLLWEIFLQEQEKKDNQNFLNN